ncbi:MAG: RsmD family RNA methyltransferase [Candidatus Kapaibacteriota bacterium]
MYITSGRLKGTIIGPMPYDGVRPTTDRMRQAIFNALSHHIDFSAPNMEVLDLCAGTGALGLEAISRGASRCIFVEKNALVAELIRKTMDKCGVSQAESPIAVSDAVSFLQGINSEQYPKTMPKQWDCIFCDPPYAARLLNPVTEAITTHNALKPGGLYIAEHDRIEMISQQVLNHVTTLSFGVTLVDIFQSA